MDVRIFSDRRCLAHTAPRGFPEQPARLEAILAAASESELPLESEVHRGGAREAVLGVHSAPYVERFERAVQRGDGLLDSADNPLSPGTAAAAWAAVEVSLSALDWTNASTSRVAFAAVRPPGHHAERSVAMGFCFFNNVAVAAQALVASGRRRVAIVDFDVHHGNGTQHLFEDRADVFYTSLHLYPYYPGTGSRSEVGTGEGVGTTLNVPLPAGSGNREYEQAFQDEIVPALAHYAPEALLVSAGFDAWLGDPLGAMTVDENGFVAWGRWLSWLAQEFCDGRLVAILEGGYDLQRLGDLVVAFLRGVQDPESPA